MNERQEKHQFSYYHDALPRIIALGEKLCINDQDLVHRIVHITRSEVGDSIEVFNQLYVVTMTLQNISKKELCGVITDVKEIQKLPQRLDIILPVLKREALEKALYTATVMGVENIYFVHTQKSAHWNSGKEQDRFKKICRAAAEQSKQYRLPLLHEPVELAVFLEKHTEPYILRLHADVQGVSCRSLISQLEKSSSVIISIGPEGDMTVAEREQLQQANYAFLKLIPFVLKAEEALQVLLGIVRSFH